MMVQLRTNHVTADWNFRLWEEGPGVGAESVTYRQEFNQL